MSAIQCCLDHGSASKPLVDLLDSPSKGRTHCTAAHMNRYIRQMALRAATKLCERCRLTSDRRLVCVSVTKLFVTDSTRKASKADVQYVDQFETVDQARLEFARNHQDWQFRHWRPVHFTNEPRFKMYPRVTDV